MAHNLFHQLNNKGNKMQTLLNKFKADQSENNRVKLQNYLNKHMMAIVCASIEDQQYLKSNGFKC